MSRMRCRLESTIELGPVDCGGGGGEPLLETSVEAGDDAGANAPLGNGLDACMRCCAPTGKLRIVLEFGCAMAADAVVAGVVVVVSLVSLLLLLLVSRRIISLMRSLHLSKCCLLTVVASCSLGGLCNVRSKVECISAKLGFDWLQL